MAQTKDKESVTPEPAGEEPVGRVEFDSRGNSVWRWARDVLDSTSILLKRLENKDLALEPTQKIPVLGSGKPAQLGGSVQPSKPDKKSRPGSSLRIAGDDGGRDSGGGFDPYNTRRR